MTTNPPIPNVWHLRTVAEVSRKNCMICFKPSTSVLITPNSKDFFYICRGHLKDRGFCSPLEDTEQNQREAMRIEVEQEYREKLAAKERKEAERQKKEKENNEKDEKGKGKDKNSAEEDKAERDKPEAAEASASQETQSPPAEQTPRIYALHR